MSTQQKGTGMKQKVGPAAIVISLVVLAAFMYGMYRLANAPQNPPVTKDNAPAYAKERGMVPGEPASGGGGASTDPSHRPAYGQGAGYGPGGAANGQTGGAPGGMGR